MSRHASPRGGFCFALAQVDVWRRAGAGNVGQLQRVLRGHTDLQSASELIDKKSTLRCRRFSMR
jgi:hypothetical protein